MTAVDNPGELLRKSLEGGRIDVLRSLLVEIGLKKEFHEIVDSAVSTDVGTLLHFAASKGDADGVRALLSAGANVCVQNDHGKTALQCAANDAVASAFTQELLQAVAQSKVLCEGGADVSAVNARGETALHDAVSRGDVSVVRRLLQYGADPATKNAKGADAYELAKKSPDVLQCLSMHNVAQNIRRTESVESLETGSLASVERLPLLSMPTSPITRTDRFLLAQDLKMENWTDILWPQPKQMVLDPGEKVFALPNDRKIRVFFHSASEADPRQMMQIWTLFVPTLTARQIGVQWVDYEGANDREPAAGDNQSPASVGGVTCGVLTEIFDKAESYMITVRESGVTIWGSDLTGLKHGLSTFVQILRRENGPSVEVPVVTVPCMVIRDGPDTKFRGVFIDFTGCRVLSVDTVCKVMNRLAYCKANQLIIHFEVRPTDKFALPYTSRELFHLRQVCEDLRVTVIPSLDLNTSSADKNTVSIILGKFLACFPQCKAFHFGTHLSVILATYPSLLEMVHFHNACMVYLSFENFGSLPAKQKRPLPAYCIICLPGIDLVQENAQLELARSCHGGGICLKFTTSDVGYFCQAPETMVKNSILAAKLGTRCPVLGTMVCDLSTGCEIMPQSLAFLPEVAILGVSWNRETDMKRFCFLLPQIGAEHILLDRKMAALFQQILTLGYVEHELSKLGYGTLKQPSPAGRTNGVAGKGDSGRLVMNGPLSGPTTGSLSVIVQLLLNPDSMTLDRLTPVTFKKARLELNRSLQALNNVKKDLPYNYELALTLAEIQLVTELMILATKMGQAICLHGTNPHPNDVTFPVINVGVANLPLTTRTDLANSLLEIRTKFQHTWLSRNQPDTLGNAVKMFDNLFRTLLPPNMQAYGENLL